MLNPKNLKQQFINSFIKKIFLENYYKKHYIRNNILDSNNIFYNFKKNKKFAFSVYNQVYNYSHVYNNKFTFNSFLNKKNLQSKNFVNNFYSSLLNFKNKNLIFFLLKPIKGGFFSYFSGVLGFIPRNNILFLIQKIFLKIKTKNFFMLLYNFINISKILKCFRFSSYFIKIKLFQPYKKRNFSSFKKVKFRKLFFRSVFLLKKN